jgi:hypothetical protein
MHFQIEDNPRLTTQFGCCIKKTIIFKNSIQDSQEESMDHLVMPL